MNDTASGKQLWLSALLAVLVLATSVCGQESDASQSSIASATPEALLELPIEPELEASFGQLVITDNTCGREEEVCVCPDDDVWLISARESHCAPSDLGLLQVSRLIDGNWVTAELSELLISHSRDKTKVTMVYAHGNRTELKWAKSRGLQFYKTALQTVPRPPIRYVMFAWRSDREVARLVPDYDIKSQRSVMIGETFGMLLGQFEDRKMVIGGFSMGAQVVLKALSNPVLQMQDDELGKYRVAIFAPALNSDFIQSELMCFTENQGVHQTDVFLNSGDRVVKFSRLIVRKRNHSGFGIKDLASSESPNNPVVIRDITKEVSNKHSVVKYGQSTLMNVQLAGMLNDTFAEGNSALPRLSEPADSGPAPRAAQTDLSPEN